MNFTLYETTTDRLLRDLDVQHFTAHELCREGSVHQGVHLTPPIEELLRNLIPTIVRLEQVRRDLGTRLRITSGYRDHRYNRAVGGSPNSYHTKFNAVDVVPLDGRSTLDLYRALHQLDGAGELFGIGRYASRGFVHFDTRGLIRHGAAPWDQPE